MVWVIPPDNDRKTSVGLVLDAATAKGIQSEGGVAAGDMLDWGIARCPRFAAAGRVTATGEAGVTADFSYACRPYAGPGYFLLGDAATFLDPIFSTGVCLAMMAARRGRPRDRPAAPGAPPPPGRGGVRARH